ncbi:hypothetical protein [Pyrococcus kukulkanii]|uniref:hypothetical protein n=1 Tax=Pyrococcus kukulkanii TaxID=1609559 RepID=UPI00356738BC
MGIIKGLRYPTILAGLLLLFLSLGLAFIALQGEIISKELSGDLSPGTHFLYDKQIVKIIDANLTLYSTNANVSVSWEGKYYNFELKNNSRTITGLHDFPAITTDGMVTYKLAVVGYSYPYSWLSPIGFIAMIAGSMLSLLGFVSYMQGEMEKVKKRKKENTHGGEDVQGAAWRKSRL